MKFIYMGLFGLVGIFSRYFLGQLVNRWLPYPFPSGTFAINLLGSAVIGVIYVMGVERAVISNDLRLGIMVGLLGGFTTFSSYCLEAARLVEDTEYLYAALYFGLSPMLGLLGAFGGLFITRWLIGAKL